MDLIEQLGGYEKANAEYEKVKHLRDSAEVERKRVVFAIGILRQDLLEYRRQRNIFEEGDFYVYLYDWDCDLDIVCKFIASEWGDHLWNIESMIRHATDEEIKTNRRLLRAVP